MMYAQNAIMVNEFRGHSWKHVSTNANMSLGVEVLESLGYFSGSHWYWIGVGALLGTVILLNSCCVLALTYLNPLGKPQAVLPENENEISTENNENMRKVVLPLEPHSITFLWLIRIRKHIWVLMH
ncbi:hypothetical protein ACP275_08G236800 [Erythranthe tilingii]